MKTPERTIIEITTKVANQFPSFGGGRGSEWNPIAEMLKNKPAQFAAGVDVRAVVEAVIKEYTQAVKIIP